MCGLVALLAPDIERANIEQINDLMIHRGPDDGGLYLGEGVALAARRLSIIDLDSGRQPVTNEDGTVWIAYNGEIFNAPALRMELLAAGHRFRSHSDTEVVVHAYEEWGDEAVGRFQGMFAFALWDNRRQRLLVARDRFGIKPLYYARHNGRFGCASMIAPLLAALPGLPRRAHREALWRLFEVGFIPTPLTAFENVYKLPAACLMVVENGHHTIRPYWQLTYPSQYQTLDLHEATDAFMEKLYQVVDAWRMSDVPVGSLLSGGVDSSALAALLADISGTPIHTFNIAFDAASHDESAHARATAEILGSRHHELIFTAADFDCLPHLIRHLEEPQCSATSIPIFRLYQACRAAGFKVIMTGEGADELLAGYHWFDGDRRLRPLLALPQPMRALFARAPLPVSPAGRQVLAAGTKDPLQRYALWQQVGTAGKRAELLGEGCVPPIYQQWQTRYGAAVEGRHPLEQFHYLDAHTRMVDFINFEVDRMSMAASVEARPPFLDHLLWEFCAGLPPQVKLNRQGNKLLLRWGMVRYLPDAVRHRPKKGLATPHAAWWRASQLPAWAEECLHPSALLATGYFNAVAVDQLRIQHQSGRADHSRLLTGILATQLWHDLMGIVAA